MKKTYLAIIFSFALTFSCILSACGNYQPNIEDEPPTIETQAENSISQQINDLKKQILELEQNNYITEIERNNEIDRLEALIENLKKQEPNNDSNTPPQQDSSSDNQEKPTPDNPEPKFIYTVENDEAIITGFIGNEENITIPSAIDGYTVTCVSDEAFASSSIKSISLPNTITKIGWFAFKNCSNLKSIVIPNSVKTIGYSAFAQTGSDFSIICAPDSFAAQYAESYGINCKPI